MKGTVSHIFDLGFSFHFMKSRKLSFFNCFELWVYRTRHGRSSVCSHFNCIHSSLSEADMIDISRYNIKK